MPTRNTLVQLLALYPKPESQSAQHNRQTDRRHDDVSSQSYCQLNSTQVYWQKEARWL